jgi:hypothetical protein
MGVSLKTENEEYAGKTIHIRGGEISPAPPWTVLDGKSLGGPPPALPIA